MDDSRDPMPERIIEDRVDPLPAPPADTLYQQSHFPSYLYGEIHPCDVGGYPVTWGAE